MRGRRGNNRSGKEIRSVTSRSTGVDVIFNTQPKEERRQHTALNPNSHCQYTYDK